MTPTDTADKNRPKQVVIFGAGIAGLTAAHELAERGFEVDVYEAEPSSPWDTIATGAPCAVGGMAKTQWTRTSRRFGTASDSGMLPTRKIHLIPDVRVAQETARDTEPKGSRETTVDPENERDVATTRGDEIRKLFEDNSRTLCATPRLESGEFKGADLWNALHSILRLYFDLPPTDEEPLQIEVRGYSAAPAKPLAFDYSLKELQDALVKDGEGLDLKTLGLDPNEPREDLRFAWKAAKALEDALVEAGIALEDLRKEGHELFRVRAMGLGRREDWTIAPSDRNFVRFTVKEDWLPGEHGFRFFPAFYRNLFDTLRRTPIANEAPQLSTGSVYAESSRTVLDNIIATELMGMTTEGQGAPFGFHRQAVHSLEEIFEQGTGMLKEMGFPLTDLNRFQLKLFKYMTSSPDRREAEYEKQTWWEFLEADKFSPNFQKYLDSTAEALVAMNAKKSDARTYGNISVQMLQDQLSRGQRTDGTLNGPTSIAWFDHWRRYLQHQGVTFHQGLLTGFEWQAGHPWAVVKRARGKKGKKVPTRIIGRDYYVLALPVKEMEKIARGIAAQIQSAKEGGVGDHPDFPKDLEPDFRRLCEMNWGDPSAADPGGSLDHMAGIQFFFDGDVKLLSGHVLYPDTPWRLSAVGQPQFWRAKRGWWSGYRGILSVDISNWHNAGEATKGDDGAAPGLAWNKTPEEIARETWNQICGSGGPPLNSGRRRDAMRKREDLPEPTLYHLDENLVLKGGRVAGNRSPLLINRAGEFRRRPGEVSRGATAKSSGYRLNFECIALAGTCMQTYTRLTTMESANESARHAVNGILEHAGFTEEERCAIYDPERYEPRDLQVLREIDRKLFKLGLPHFVDILSLTAPPKALLRPDPDLNALGLGQHVKEALRGE